MSKDMQPVYILPEDVQRSQGRVAQRNNILAAKLVAETVRTTLGPKGMDKMLVDSMGDIIITNDGVTILREMNIEHPAAKMIVEVAITQEEEVGDGTTSAVVLAGELLKKAEGLLEQNIHPSILVKGYRLALETTLKILDNMSDPLKERDLFTIATTAMTGKGAESSKNILSDIVVRSVQSVQEEEYIDKNNIKIETSVGGSIDDSELIEGIVLDKERVHSDMPRKIKNANIALINSPIEIKNTEMDAKIQITDPSQLQQFLEMEEQMLKDMVNKIIESGANVLFCQKGIDDVAQHFLAKQGVYACRRVKKSDMEKLSRATGARIINKINDISPEDLGTSNQVNESKVGDEEMTFVEGCTLAKSVTILIKGATEHVVDEIKRAVEDAIGGVISAIKSQKIVAGAGATEIEVARNLRLYSQKLSGREQLAIDAFADSLEVIPRTLAESAGSDPIDILTELKAVHESGKKWAGIDVFSGKVMDAYKEGVVEPLKIKTQAISSAAEVAIMILRIDDVIASGSMAQNNQLPEGM